MWKKSKLVACLCLLTPMLTLAQYKNIDYTKSYVSFTIKNAGLKVDGRFDQYVVQLNLDPQNLSATRIEADIKVLSINTGIKGRDNHLRKEEFFHVDRFPSILFKLTSVKKQSTGDYVLFGKLTIKGITKEVSMPMNIKKENGLDVYASNLVINRQDFHVGEDSWIMSDEVLITIKIVSQ